MIRRPPRSTRTDTLFPYTTLFRSEPVGLVPALLAVVGGLRRVDHDRADREVEVHADQLGATVIGGVPAGVGAVAEVGVDDDVGRATRCVGVAQRAAVDGGWEERRVGKGWVRTCRYRVSAVYE